MESEQAERWELWRQRITEQERSGGSIRAYCKENGLPEHAFYGWRSRLQSEAPVGFGLVQSKPVMKEASMLELGVSQNAIVLFCFGSKSVVVYFSTATTAAHAALCGLLLLRRLYPLSRAEEVALLSVNVSWKSGCLQAEPFMFASSYS